MLVELALSEREAEVDRSRALRLMGFDPERRVRVLAVAAETDPGFCREAVTVLAHGHLGGPVRCTVLDGVAAVLLQGADLEGSPTTAIRAALEAERAKPSGRGFHRVVVGVGGSVDGLSAYASWQQARVALRFTASDRYDQQVAEYELLGALTMMAELPPARLRENPDVMALDRLSPSDIEALEALCWHGSLRQAAAAMGLHHSSVASRLAQIDATLGWHLDTPIGRVRATVALLARRVLSTHL